MFTVGAHFTVGWAVFTVGAVLTVGAHFTVGVAVFTVGRSRVYSKRRS